MVFSIHLVKDGFLELLEDDSIVTIYRYGGNVRKPYFYPLYAPKGIMVTRDEPPDHIHHRSLWTAHGSVNGVDIWSEGVNAGYIRCVDTPMVSLKEDRAVLYSTNVWVSKAGDKLMKEHRIVTFWRTIGDIRFIDYDVEFEAEYSDIVLGDTKEGGIVALRVVDSMRESVGGGVITNSEGGVGEPRCWGKRARWCDYTGRVNGEVAGITIFDHPRSIVTRWYKLGLTLFYLIISSISIGAILSITYGPLPILIASAPISLGYIYCLAYYLYKTRSIVKSVAYPILDIAVIISFCLGDTISNLRYTLRSR